MYTVCSMLLSEHLVISSSAKTSVWNVKDNKICRYVHLYIKYTRCTEAHVQGLLFVFVVDHSA